MSATTAVAQAPQGWVRRFRNNPTSLVGLAIFLAVILAAVFAPWIWPVDPLEQDVVERLVGPSLAHPLGTDSFGRDVLARLLHAGRISLLIGVSSIALAMLVGSAIGIAAGYIGGWFDAMVSSLLDVLLSFPTLLLGLMIYKQWPASGLWVIGLFVGIEMLFNGWAWIMLALSLRSSRAKQS